MTTSEQIDAIADALAKAQAQIKPAVKDATNPHFKSKYADLTSVWDAIRGPLSANGIAAVQEAVTVDEGVAVMTRLIHRSGQWLEFGPLTVPAMKRDAHGVGSATSYAKRYALSAAVGVVSDEDDDGNAAVKAKPEPVAQPAKPPKFDAWLADLESTADEGIDALKAAWTGSPVPMRQFLTVTDPEKLERLKVRAARLARTDGVPA